MICKLIHVLSEGISFSMSQADALCFMRDCPFPHASCEIASFLASRLKKSSQLEGLITSRDRSSRVVTLDQMSEARIASMQELKVDAAQQLRTGMWRFRSGLSNKQLLVPKAERATDAGEEILKDFWEVALPHVEKWSENFLDKRFHFP